MNGVLAESLEELYEEAPCGYVTTRADGTVLRVNRTFVDWTGHERAGLAGRRFQDLLSPGGRIYHETHIAPLLQMQDAVTEIALELVRADGERLPVLVNYAVKRDGDGRPSVVRITVFSAVERRGYERELLRARKAEQAAREAADAAARRASLLGEIGRTMDREPTLHGRVDRLLDALVPEVAAGARVQVAALDDGPGAVRSAGDLHPDPDTVVLPLRSRTGEVGSLALVKPKATAEPRFLSEVADRASVSLENARLYDHERSVALVLQRSLLGDPPRSDGRFAVAAHYQPGVRSLQVGGDWHDAFLVGDDVIAVTVGDVVGRGLQAASAMGQLRNAVRALAGTGMGPAALLAQLDRFVDQAEGGRSATLVYGELSLRDGTLRYAAAGHPPPAVLDADGRARLLWDGRSAPVGVAFYGRPREEAEARLTAGDRLVLYTDGVVERRGETIDDGLDRLVGVLGRSATRSGADLLGALTGELLDAAPLDDVCLLCLDLQRLG